MPPNKSWLFLRLKTLLLLSALESHDIALLQSKTLSLESQVEDHDSALLEPRNRFS